MTSRRDAVSPSHDARLAKAGRASGKRVAAILGLLGACTVVGVAAMLTSHGNAAGTIRDIDRSPSTTAKAPGNPSFDAAAAESASRAERDHSANTLLRSAFAATTDEAAGNGRLSAAAWDELWRAALARGPGHERTRALARLLEDLHRFAPDAATEKLRALHPDDRVAVVGISLGDAAGDSTDAAVDQAIRFCDQDPAYSLEYGRALVSALIENGDPAAALDFIYAEDDKGRVGENSSKWLDTLFAHWAASAPLQAAQNALAWVPPGQREEALQTLAAIWVKADPEAPANFAWNLPAQTPGRQAMLTTALNRWTDQDAPAATAWLRQKQQSLAPGDAVGADARSTSARWR